MIRRDAGVSHWKRRQYGPNVAALVLEAEIGYVTIINVYNPQVRGPRVQEWPRIELALQEAQGEVILLGDFNAHHTQWGGVGVACDQDAQHLLDTTHNLDLTLLTSQGETTWRRGLQNSVIDLTFASPGISGRVVYCGPEERWAMPQDHIPIKIIVDVGQLRDTHAKRMRYALYRLDIEGLTHALRLSNWQQAENSLEALHSTLQDLLPRYCPESKPCHRARPNWSLQAAELLAGARRARRRYTATHQDGDLIEYRHLSNSLKREMRRNTRANWRRLVRDLSNDQRRPRVGLWRLSAWSRRVTGKSHADSRIPALRNDENETATDDDTARSEILARKFFPQPLETTVRDVGEEHASTLYQINQAVTEEEVAAILGALPSSKAPGPDRIPNEVLKALAPEISKGIAQGISRIFAGEAQPPQFRESITLALRKEGRKDYSLPTSYRPIALENTLAKVLEKVLANRLSDAAETHGLLPWNQMGARKDRSTTTAIGLLTTCVQTAWSAKPRSVVSVLSLDIAGAFDNVSHDRLQHALRRKGIPEWMLRAIAGFTQDRRTRIAYPGFESEWVTTSHGIPQGSPLSPILFLFFISELLERFSDPENDLLGLGFVDDTNLIAWGATAEDNCRRLTAAHAQCEEWARENGARFAPDKYQLLHFTKRKRHACEDLASSIQIGDHRVQPQDKTIKVLGVWLDPSLTWKEHISQAARKGQAASEALSRLVTSTWGPSARNSRLLYSAVVRPTLTYGSQEWSMRLDGKSHPVATLAPLHRVQNECLRKVSGAYKRTPRAIVERETGVTPIDLYLEIGRYKQTVRTRPHLVEAQITRTADTIWRRMRGARGSRQRPPTSRETVRLRAQERIQEIEGVDRPRTKSQNTRTRLACVE